MLRAGVRCPMASAAPLRSPYRSWMFSQIQGGKASSNINWPPSSQLSAGSNQSPQQLDDVSSQLGSLLQTVRKQHADLRAQMGEVNSPANSLPSSNPSPNDLQNRRVQYAASSAYPPSASDGVYHRKLVLEQTPPTTPERVAPVAVPHSCCGSGGIVEPPWPSQPIFVSTMPQPEPEPEPEPEPRSPFESQHSYCEGSSFAAASTRAYFDPYSRENISYRDADHSASPAVDEALQHRPQGLPATFPATKQYENPRSDKPGHSSPSIGRPGSLQSANYLEATLQSPPGSPPLMDLHTLGKITAVLAGLEEQTQNHLKVIRCMQHWAACVALIHASGPQTIGTQASGVARDSAGGFRSSSGEPETEAGKQQHWDENRSRRISEQARAGLAAVANDAQASADDAHANGFAKFFEESSRSRVHDGTVIPGTAADEADGVSTLLASAAEHVARSKQVFSEEDAAWRAAAALLCRQIEESMPSSGVDFEASDIGASSARSSG